MSTHAVLKGPLVTRTTLVCAVLALICGALLACRFIFGLGYVTNISNGYPWGIWVVYDIMIATALACGGYAMALLVYVMNRGRYHPLVRPALLASVLGYTLGGGAIMADLGRYWNFWHIFLPNYVNLRSVMVEVSLCIISYIVVLWIEFTPVFLERWGGPQIRERMGKVLFFFIALGVLLPTMHQSSLGSMGFIFGYLIHPLWHTPLMPVLFLISAICMGYAVVVFEATLSSRSYKLPSETRLLSGVSRCVGWLCLLFLTVRFADLVIEGKSALILTSGFLSLMFAIEFVLFALPIVLVRRATIGQARAQFLAACSLLVAASLYRIDVYLVAYHRPGWRYFPAASELLVTFGMIAIEVLLYIVIIKTHPVLHIVKPAAAAAATTRH
jgi:Ni/Fe-hydrogenase subunit HybB-like protein